MTNREALQWTVVKCENISLFVRFLNVYSMKIIVIFIRTGEFIGLTGMPNLPVYNGLTPTVSASNP